MRGEELKFEGRERGEVEENKSALVPDAEIESEFKMECEICQKMVSYDDIDNHEKKCRVEKDSEEARSI